VGQGERDIHERDGLPLEYAVPNGACDPDPERAGAMLLLLGWLTAGGTA